MEKRNNEVLDKFPAFENNKLKINSFLNASKGMVKLIDDLGRLFSPLSYDMSNNISKIEKGNTEFGFKIVLEDLLLAEREQNQNVIFEAVVWLTRGLKFLRIFFKCLIDEKDGDENLENTMIKAYQGSLEPYHGWMTRQLFSFFKKVCPSRTVTLEILKKRLGTNDVINELNIFSNNLEQNLNHIHEFLNSNNFYCNLISK